MENTQAYIYNFHLKYFWYYEYLANNISENIFSLCRHLKSGLSFLLIGNLVSTIFLENKDPLPSSQETSAGPYRVPE
jgi:hypothetical protein